MPRLARIENDFQPLPRLGPAHMAEVTGGLRLAAPANDGLPAVRTVLAVGALYDDVTKLHARDSALLRYALQCAQEIGLPVSDKLTIDVANLHYGHNYLLPGPYDADIVALCYIPIVGNTGQGHPNSVISPYGNRIGQWRKRLGEDRPLIAVSAETRGAEGEITVRAACPSHYRKMPAARLNVVPQWNEPNGYTAHAIVRKDIGGSRELPAP